MNFSNIKSRNLRSKEIFYRNIQEINDNQVAIKVQKVIVYAEKCLEGRGIVVETGVLCRRFLGKNVSFFNDDEKSRQCVSEFVVVDYKMCSLFCDDQIFYYECLNLIMLCDLISNSNYQSIINISENPDFCEKINKFLGKHSGKIFHNDTGEIKARNSSSLLLVGCLKNSKICLEKFNNLKEILIYDLATTLEDLDMNFIIQNSIKINGFSVLKNLKSLSLLQRHTYSHLILNNQALFTRNIPSLPFFHISIESVDSSIPIYIEFSEFFSITSPLTTKKTVPPLSKSFSNKNLSNFDQKAHNSVTSIEEIIDISCLESPRVSFIYKKSTDLSTEDYLSPIMPKLNNESTLSFDSSDQSLQYCLEDFSLIDYLTGLITKYRNISVLEVLSKLPQIYLYKDLSETIEGTYLKILSDHSIYEGQFNREREPHGFGSRYYTDGSVYRGFWKHGQANGQGQLVTTEGFIYNGKWKNGLYHGYGSLKSQNGNFAEGDFEKGELHGIGIQVLQNGDKFHGNFRNGLKHGNGKLIKKNGIIYLGEFENGKMKGSGKVIYPGKKFFGKFENDVGFGVMEYHDGCKFYGRILNFIEDGAGIFEDLRGTKQCIAKNGVLDIYYGKKQDSDSEDSDFWHD